MVWLESREVITAFVDGRLAGASQIMNAPDFDECLTHVPSAPTGPGPKKTIDMALCAGHAVICNLGHGNFTIALLCYDRGVLKYDPELAPDREALQQVADAVHQRRLCAYKQYVLQHGHPSDLGSYGKLHDAGEVAVPAELRADMERLRALVCERDAVVLRLRAQAAGARGSAIGFTSEQVTEVANGTHAARVTAAGRKTFRGKEDPARIEQFETFLVEQHDLIARRHPYPHHMYRPDDMRSGAEGSESSTPDSSSCRRAVSGRSARMGWPITNGALQRSVLRTQPPGGSVCSLRTMPLPNSRTRTSLRRSQSRSDTVHVVGRPQLDPSRSESRIWATIAGSARTGTTF